MPKAKPIFCSMRSDRGVICYEAEDVITAPCINCGWNPVNVDLRRKRIKQALKRRKKILKAQNEERNLQK